MTALPRPDVKVETVPSSANSQTGNVTITISRDGKSKTYLAEGIGDNATAEAVGKILSDGHTAEWLP